MPAWPHAGVQVTTPVPVSNVAPPGSASALHTGVRPAAQPVRSRAGVTVSSDSSTTVCGSGVTVTATPPGVSVTRIENVSVSDSPLAAVAVSVYGP